MVSNGNATGRFDFTAMYIFCTERVNIRVTHSVLTEITVAELPDLYVKSMRALLRGSLPYLVHHSPSISTINLYQFRNQNWEYRD